MTLGVTIFVGSRDIILTYNIEVTMAMPRPSGRVLKIAEKVVPGLKARSKPKRRLKNKPIRGSLSEVETKKTQQNE